jgi:hypothetical protein
VLGQLAAHKVDDHLARHCRDGGGGEPRVGGQAQAQ